MKKLRMAIIGPGAFGQFCMGIYKNIEDLELAAVVGTDEASLKQVADKFGVKRIFTDWKKAVNDPAIDIVGIFTPPFLHGEMALECIRAKKPFLVEKPLATDKSVADKIVEEAKVNNVPGTIGYVMRYTENYARVKELVETKKFGKLTRMIFENYASSEGLPKTHWLWDEKKSGGILVEHGVHFFDIFNNIAGTLPEEVKGYVASNHEVFAAVKYPGDILATFYHNFDKKTATEQNYASFVFENGYARVNGWIPLELELEWMDEDGKIQNIRYDVGDDKQSYYALLVEQVMRDLICKIKDPSYKQKVTLENGRDSVKVAIEAKENPIF